jgi:hypothetical protein
MPNEQISYHFLPSLKVRLSMGEEIFDDPAAFGWGYWATSLKQMQEASYCLLSKPFFAAGNLSVAHKPEACACAVRPGYATRICFLMPT